MKDLLSFLDGVPERYKRGRWSKLAHLGVLSIALWIGVYYREAQRSFNEDVLPEISGVSSRDGPSANLQLVRVFVGSYFFLFISFCIYMIGPWPLVSYTISSWNVLTMRYLAAYFATLTADPTIALLARTLKFPALVMNTITVTVWWGVLVPLIYFLLKSKAEKEGFMKFNFSVFLLHIHGLNLPVAIYEFLASSSHESLHFYDLYCSICMSFVYMLWYLNILDPAGIQIYIVFTPRTRWSLLTYVTVFTIHLGLYHGALQATELYKAPAISMMM